MFKVFVSHFLINNRNFNLFIFRSREHIHGRIIEITDVLAPPIR